MFTDWLSFGRVVGEGGGGGWWFRLKLDVQGQGGGRIWDVDGQGVQGVLKIAHGSHICMIIRNLTETVALVFVHFSEYLLLFLDDNVGKESE